ncbi:MAG: SDR family oxidoreductase [Candidatus Bathyarchaeia archaeon]|jgi:NAD(P)-dependent dehydrogenase (short-subunit alcohol dehydrogenase family)
MTKFDFTGKVALVTGSGRGIGLATSRKLLESGARVMLNEINPKRLDMAMASLGQLSKGAVAHRGDVTKGNEVEEIFEDLISKWGHIDILVNNAADRPIAKVVDMTEEVWDRNLNSILKGAFLCSKAASRRMISRGVGGKIVNVSSGSYKVARVGASAYCAAKAGLVMFTACLAQELGPNKINVNSVAPGLIEVGDESTPEKLSYDKATVQATPWAGIGAPEDIANAILMLCSPEAEFITGTVLSVDGGLSVGRYGIPVSP